MQRSVAERAVSAAKSALGIHSPSRVFKEIGAYTMEGFGIGINNEGRNVISGMGSMAKSVTDAFNPQLNVPNIQRDIKTLVHQLMHKLHILMNIRQIHRNVL